jgi:hypothetical protein
MTASEFMFLAVGLLLGVASGVAVIELIRARPAPAREVRVTVAQDAIPRRRASTLADDAFATASPEPARGGPADRRGLDGPAPAGTPERRTNVLDRVRATAGSMTGAGLRAPSRLVGMPISAGADPVLVALRAGRSVAARTGPSPESRERPFSDVGRAADPTDDAAAVRPETPPALVALLDPPDPTSASVAPGDAGPCAEERRLADERCELATRAGAQAAAALDTLARAQRAYDDHIAASAKVVEAADPRVIRRRKEAAQHAFRAASGAAGSPAAAEAAATTWLHEINRINHEAAGASLAARREHEAAAAIAATLETLIHEAEAARVRAEMADAACLAARSAVADCDELATEEHVARPSGPPPSEPVLTGISSTEALGIAYEGGTTPRIFRLLKGDPDEMAALVTALAGDDPDEQRRWQVNLTGLLDAILADAIEASCLRFPHDHPFWGPYALQQQRDIARALASLGLRFDGHGGWVDVRLPTQRELSLALGFAGLDPMRVRHWPSEEEAADLLREVDVAADEYLAVAAGDLTLAEMVEMLGRRADGLVELWNQWGQVRPLLLEEI